MPKLQLAPGPAVRRAALISSGSGALLVILNLLISAVALVPLLLEWSGWLSVLAVKYLGGFAILTMMAAYIAEAAIGKAGYVACSPVLLAACIVLPLLLVNSGIRRPVKLAIVMTELGACAVLIRTVGRLMLQYQQGHFRGF
jgi:hypothetical protein